MVRIDHSPLSTGVQMPIPRPVSGGPSDETLLSKMQAQEMSGNRHEEGMDHDRRRKAKEKTKN